MSEATYTFDLADAAKRWPQLRIDILNSLQLYVEHRLGPGSFLRAVLENNLLETINHAGDDERSMLQPLVAVVNWYVPIDAWGSRAKVNAWLRRETP